MARSSPPRAPKVTIIVDVNILFSDNVDRLFGSEFSNFCRSEISSYGIVYEIILPEIVILERRRQMLSKAIALSASVVKLQTLTGANWGLSEEVLGMHIDAAIARQMQDCSVTSCSIDASRVDWVDLITKAAKKLPPFSPEKEKGFKDAIILECASQLIEDRPKSPSVHRVLFLTSDDLLVEAAKQRFQGTKNVLVLSSIDDVRTQLSAIAAHLSEDYIANLLPKADKIFFDEATSGGIYYSENLLDQIDQKFPSEMKSLPDGFSKVSIVKNYVTIPPTFVSKNGQRLHFATRVRRAVRATGSNLISTTSGLLGSLLADTALQEGSRGLAGEVSAGQEIFKSGSHSFDVRWSATLGVNGRLTKPSIDKITYTGGLWEN